MKKALLLSLAVTVFWILPLFASTIHVPDDYTTIQAGIDASVNGDTVLVAPGVYGEHITFNGRAILLKSSNGPEVTVIEKVTNQIPIVRFENGEGENSVLDGFTVRNSSEAPAVNVFNAGPTIINNLFVNNINNNSDGGAINVLYGTIVRIFDNVFEDNSSVYGTGGGVRSYGVDLIIRGNIFRGNNAGTHGGAIHLRASANSVVDHNLFEGNHCLALGGALCMSENSGGEIFNNTVAGNSNSEFEHGAGIVIWYSSGCHIYNNIVASNSGKGVYSYPPNNSTAAYNDVWNNTLDYSGIEPGDGSISDDPLFVGGEPYSFELAADSPCIDAGDPNSPADPNGSIADMGAYPYGGAPPNGISLDIADIDGQPDQPADVPVTSFGFSERPISGLEFHIAYRQPGLEFTGMTSDYLTGALVNVVNGVVNIVWENFAAPIVVPEEDNMLVLHFNVTGQNGSAYRIEWRSGSEVVDTLGNPLVNVRYFNGGVSIMEPRSLGGQVSYYDLQRNISNVTIALSREDTATAITGLDGLYNFENMRLGNYLVRGSREDDDPGVSIADIIMIERHLAQLESLDSPYKYVAADVNGSGTISMADVIKIRRYLAQLESLPAGNWAFIDASYTITPSNWAQAPACREANLIGENLTDVNLIGVRIGDVDDSWTFIRNMHNRPITKIESASLSLGQVSGNPGDIVTLNLTADELTGVAGLELHLSYPSEGLRFIGISSNLPMEPTIGSSEGLAHLIWENGLNTIDLLGGSEVASFSFEILQNAPQEMTVSIYSGYVVNRDGDLISTAFGDGHIERLTSNGSDGLTPGKFSLAQNYPNPFNASTRISFSLTEACHVNLDIFDMTGRKVAILESGQFEAGVYDVIWNGKSDRGAPLSSGIYFYQLKAGSFMDTRRMLMLK